MKCFENTLTRNKELYASTGTSLIKYEEINIEYANKIIKNIKKNRVNYPLNSGSITRRIWLNA